MVVRYLQSRLYPRLRLRCTPDIAIGIGNLRSPTYRLLSTTPARDTNSRSAEQLPRTRIKASKKRKKSTLPTSTAPNESLLAKTMKQLLEAISETREQLQCIRPWFWDLVKSEEKRQILVDCAIVGFQKAGSYAILEDGACTLGQLVKKAQSAKFAEVDGVYARIYMHGFERPNWSLYIGSSGNIKAKMKDHNWIQRRRDGHHARAYEGAIGKRHRVLCNLDGDIYAQQNLGVRLVVEQLLVIMLGTYMTHNLHNYIACDDGRWVEGFKARFIRDTKTSIILARLGSEVCEQCGWKPTTERSDSNEEFGTDVNPLNWISPIYKKPRLTSNTTRECETKAMTIYRKAVTEVVLATGCLGLDDIESRDSRSDVDTIVLA